MLYICVRDVIEVVFSVCIVERFLAQCCANCIETRTPPRLDFSVFWGKLTLRTRWITEMHLIKAGDVETTPDLITHKQDWTCDICHKQIHGTK